MAAVEPERIRRLVEDPRPDGTPDGRYVLYWMQASQRAEHNPALEHAASIASERRLPLVVLAVVIPDYPEASARQFAFMLGGLGRALRAVERRGMHPCLRVGDPVDVVVGLAAGAAHVVVDRGYLRHQRHWYDELAGRVGAALDQVEGDVVVPAELATDRHETGARTIRPRLAEHRDRFLVPLTTVAVHDRTVPDGTTSDIDLDRLADIDGIAGVLDEIGVSGPPDPVDADDSPTPGVDAARVRLRRVFEHVRDRGGYDATRARYSDPLGCSMMSPYLHHGQISPVHVALLAREGLGVDGAEPFLEELIVRRELAVNHVLHEPDYDSWAGLPEWARSTLEQHRDDERDHVYTASELEAGSTHDEVWNAVMALMRRRGWVHNQLRMYWGKQILRWTNTPQHAFRTALELNNRWFLDGRDPNSFANVGWCFGLHDRGFQERPVTGTVRPFTTAALERKDDLEAWLSDVSVGSADGA